MEPQLSHYSPGGIAFAKVDEMIFSDYLDSDNSDDESTAPQSFVYDEESQDIDDDLGELRDEGEDIAIAAVEEEE